MKWTFVDEVMGDVVVLLMTGASIVGAVREGLEEQAGVCMGRVSGRPPLQGVIYRSFELTNDLKAWRVF